jgi:hypothetical protein
VSVARRHAAASAAKHDAATEPEPRDVPQWTSTVTPVHSDRVNCVAELFSKPNGRRS